MTLHAGTAVRDISPLKPVFLVGYPHVPRVSEGIHDPLLATALCLTDESTSILLVAVDILFMDPGTARKLRSSISDCTSVPEEHVFISCTHTHSGPVTLEMMSWADDPVVPPPDPEYMKLFTDGIVAAADEAARSRRRCEIGWASAQIEGVGCNRLSHDGPRDPEAGILVVRDAGSGRTLAVSVTYSMHPTVLHEDSRFVSADFPYYARTQIKEAMGRDTVVLCHTGPAGNQSPRYHVRSQSFEEAERLGRRLGREVIEASSILGENDFTDDASLTGAIGAVELPSREIPSVEYAEAGLKRCRDEYERLKRENAGHGPVRTAECSVFGAEELVTLSRAQARGALKTRLADYARAEVQVLRIGKTYVVGLPGELFTEYALDLKGRVEARVVVVSLVNGDLQGYIVTPETDRAGGYEATNSLFEPRSGQVLIDAAVDLIEKM